VFSFINKYSFYCLKWRTPRPKLKIRLSRALSDSENLVGLMGSTNRVTSLVLVWLPTFLLQVLCYFIRFLCSDGIGWHEWKLVVWGGGGGWASEMQWGKIMAKSKLERWFPEVSRRVLFIHPVHSYKHEKCIKADCKAHFIVYPFYGVEFIVGVSNPRPAATCVHYTYSMKITK